VQFQLTEGDLSSYQAVADSLNSSNVDLVCLQHEYGIFGGKAGSHVLHLLQRLKLPVVTTLHQLNMTATSMRPLRFVGDSLEVLRELPEEVKDEIGFALERVQRGKMPENAKPLKGIAPGRAGNCFRLPGRYVQGRLYREVPKGCSRFACFPEEVQTGHRDAEA
jgi:hypothetical protein